MGALASAATVPEAQVPDTENGPAVMVVDGNDGN